MNFEAISDRVLFIALNTLGCVGAVLFAVIIVLETQCAN